MNTKTRRLGAALGVAAAAIAPVLLFGGAGTAQAADPSCYDALQGSYYCYLDGGTPSQAPAPEYTPAQPAFGYNNLPGCSGGALPAITGALSGDGCS